MVVTSRGEFLKFFLGTAASQYKDKVCWTNIECRVYGKKRADIALLDLKDKRRAYVEGILCYTKESRRFYIAVANWCSVEESEYVKSLGPKSQVQKSWEEPPKPTKKRVYRRVKEEDNLLH